MIATLEQGRDTDLTAWMALQGERIERALERILPRASGSGRGFAPDELHEAMRYAVLGGGKRVRPLLVYAAGEISGAAPAVLDASACAVELIHAYSLVHDDMPCMDDDDLRRGKLTVHRKYGEAQAMLVGDALQALAFEALVAPLLLAADAPAAGSDGFAGAARSDVPVATMIATLARAAGSQGMAGGQSLDLAAVGVRLDRHQLQTMHQKKTGAMLVAAVRLGMLCGGPLSRVADDAVVGYGEAVGLAFQVVDDILDVIADSSTLGKTAGKDRAQDKPTYVSILGLAESQALARELGQRAHLSLAPFGPHGLRLGELADFIMNRHR